MSINTLLLILILIISSIQMMRKAPRLALPTGPVGMPPAFQHQLIRLLTEADNVRGWLS